MDYLSHNVAVNLNRIRTSKGMSLDAVSEQTGVSKSMLAQIEKDAANPSLGTLGKIASGLRIEFHELIDTPPMESCLVDIKDMIVYYMTTVVVNKKQIENAIKKIMFKNQLYIRSLSQQIDNRRIVADILERIKTPC